ncbi:MAG: uracil phosphoribosyltransferase [Pirellulaceae bacterium]|nr:MAG: uracil phosphoribosyltransferase [Pirellulaceae bacterium]
MTQVHVIQHPLLQHHLSILREKTTPPWLFRQQVRRAATILAGMATSDLPTQPVPVHTPLATMTGARLACRIALIPILRAGLGLVDPLQDMIPEAQVWHLGMYRDEQTARPVEYYCKLPHDQPADVAFVLDPMLATGGSIAMAVEALQQWGCPDIRILSLIASQPGIDFLCRQFANLNLFVAAIDPELNEQKFIVPGLGDAGDRIFNTQR